MFRSSLSLDRMYRRLTMFVIGLLAVVFATTWFMVGTLALPIVAFVAVAMVLAWAMAPRELVVAGDELRVERRAWRALRIPRSTIESATALPGLSGRTLRIGGVGGFFGSYGLFTNGDLGRFRLYSTRRGQALIVKRTRGLPIVITPDDVPGAVEALRGTP
jgi:hypothetical protein